MLTNDASGFERLLRRDRLVVMVGLAAIAGLAWVYTIHLAVSMGAMSMPHVQPWGVVDFVLMFLMWAVMMVAMMLPSAAPMVLVFARIKRRRPVGADPRIVTAVFVLAYVMVWGAFSMLATVLNWALHQGGLLTSMMGSTGSTVGGVLLLTAGLYQWTPLKHACLNRCRSPLAFLMSEWRDGRLGAFVMGLRHGVYCLLCCWALMLLLFVLGVMNVLWIAALAAIVLAEKVLPGGRRLSRSLGVVLIVWGGWMLVVGLG